MNDIWQKCPVCEGTGQDKLGWLVNGLPPVCSVCKGEKMVSRITGRPPQNV